MGTREYIENLTNEDLERYAKNVVYKESFFDILLSAGRPSEKQAKIITRHLEYCGMPTEMVALPGDLYIACITLRERVCELSKASV